MTITNDVSLTLRAGYGQPEKLLEKCFGMTYPHTGGEENGCIENSNHNR